jgi:phosphoglycerate kinase
MTLMAKLALKDLFLKGKRVLMRVDFNVPLSNKGEITDDSRIIAAIPSIEFILAHGASLILLSHLGRPMGQSHPQFSLKPVAQRLSELLHKPVPLAPDCIGAEVKKMASALRPGQVLMLENVRFHQGEEEPEKDSEFTEKLAALGDLYVNDAFGTAHRAHASTALIAKYFPGKAAMGFLMEKEISSLSSLLEGPKRPFYAILGGAKVSSKAGVIHNLVKKVDALFLGGGMAFTFLKAEGIQIGSSIVEDREVKNARELLSESKEVHLPSDLVIANRFSESAHWKVIQSKEGIPDGWQGMDIGPETIRSWSSLLQKAYTIFWNGPLGVFEMPPFAKGTREIGTALAHSKARVIVGGGDSVAAIQQMGLGDQFAHLSTGGGATLELLEFGHLPGIDALSAAKLS